jgi:hypothetical protein
VTLIPPPHFVHFVKLSTWSSLQLATRTAVLLYVKRFGASKRSENAPANVGQGGSTMKAKKKGFSQGREEAMFAQVSDALARLHPELTANESSFGVCYAMPYAWNNGKPGRWAGMSLTVDLSGDTASSQTNIEPVKEVYAHQGEMQRAAESPSGLLFVLFGIDNAIAFTRLKLLDQYRCTIHKHYVVPVSDLTFLTKFIGEYANPEFPSAGFSERS